jgi:hypothetical protein
VVKGLGGGIPLPVEILGSSRRKFLRFWTLYTRHISYSRSVWRRKENRMNKKMQIRSTAVNEFQCSSLGLFTKEKSTVS